MTSGMYSEREYIEYKKYIFKAVTEGYIYGLTYGLYR